MDISSAEQEITALFSKLAVTEDRFSLLQEIEAGVKLAGPASVAKLAVDGGLYSQLFGMLSCANSPEENACCCSILSELLRCGSQEVKSKVQPLLIDAFISTQDPCTKAFCLKQINWNVSETADISNMSDNFLCQLLDFLALSPHDFGLAERLLEAIGDLTDCPDNLLYPERSAFASNLARLLKESKSEAFFRVIKVLVAWCCKRESYFIACCQAGHLVTLLSTLLGDTEAGDNGGRLAGDPLSRRCALEEVSVLAKVSFGAAYLEKERVYDVLYDNIALPSHNLEEALLRPGIFKFFVTAYRENTTNWDFSPLYKSIIAGVCDGEMGDELEALGIMGEGTDGKRVLCKSDKISEAIRTIGHLAKTPGPEQFRVTAFSVLSKLIDNPEASGSQPNDLETATQLWFNLAFGGLDSAASVLLSVISPRQVSTHIRASAWSLLRAVVGARWGVAWVGERPSVIGRLFQRGETQGEDEREQQYACICRLVKSPHLRACVDPKAQLELRRYWKDGPVGKAEAPAPIPQVAYAER